jgi:hypothetical protein
MLKGTYRTPDGKAQIEWELRDHENGPEFSASGNYAGGGGQNLEEIATAYPDDVMVQRIVKVWRRYHLNAMNAGLPVQSQAIEDWQAAGNQYDYGEACKHLESIGLLDVPIPEGAKATGGFHNQEALFWEDGKSYYRCGEYAPSHALYRYGTRWVHSPIPAEVIAEIESWPTDGPSESLGEYQAKEFLRRNGLKLRISLSNSKPCPFNPDHAGNHYRVTLSGEGRRITFDFWGSAKDADEHKKPSTHTIMNTVADESHSPEDFHDFCLAYGYDEDSRTDLQVFRRCDRFAKRLREFLTDEEIEQLAEIR